MFFSPGFRVPVAAIFLMGALASACASSGSRPVASTVAANNGDWAKWAKQKLGITPETLWVTVAFDAEGASEVIFYRNKKREGSVERGSIGADKLTLQLGFPGLDGGHAAFFETLAAYAFFQNNPRTKKAYVELDGAAESNSSGLGLRELAREKEKVDGVDYGVVYRESVAPSSELRALFESVLAPVPQLPAKKQRLTFTGDFDPAEEFRKAGLDPAKIDLVVTEERGEELSYDVEFFHDRYYLGGVAFAEHPKRWEDYSGIPSAVLHGRGLGTLLYIVSAFQLKDFSKKPLISDGNRSGQATAVWENLVAAGWAKKSFPPGSGEIAVYKFEMGALKSLRAMRAFSERRILRKVSGGEL